MFETFLQHYSKPDARKWFDTKYDIRIQYGDPEEPQTIALWLKDGTNTKQAIPPDEEILRVGCSGYNRRDNVAEFALVDLDTDHGKELPQEEVDARVAQLAGKMEIIRSTGGNGYHGRILIDPLPCHSESEYREICRAARKAVSEETGVDLPSDDCGILWVASRTINDRSFELISNSSPRYQVELPSLPESRLTIQGTKEVSVFEVVSLLNCIDPDTYPIWLEVGQALHRLEGETGLPGFALWADWSRRSAKWQEGVCESKWGTFGNPASGKRVGLTRLRNLAGVKKERFEFTPLNDFLDTEFNQVELIEGFLVEDQYTFFAGAEKTLKTTLGLEAAIALATGTPFLGEFPTLKRRVVMMSRESGGYTLRETVKRQLASRGLDRLEDDSFILSEDLPRFESDSDLATLERYLADMGTEVFLLDPTYLAMTASDQRTREKDGQQFDRIGQVCRAVGATCVLIEHANKGSVEHKKPRPMRISDLPFGGGPAWARQFWLMARVKEYQDGSGLHELWFRVAGSTGLSSLHRLTIDEGTDWKNRKWEVSLRPESEVQRETKELEERCKQDALEEQVLKVLSDEPMLLSTIKKRVNGKPTRENLEAMVEQGLVEACEIQVIGRTRIGYRRKP